MFIVLQTFPTALITKKHVLQKKKKKFILNIQHKHAIPFLQNNLQFGINVSVSKQRRLKAIWNSIQLIQ